MTRHLPFTAPLDSSRETAQSPVADTNDGIEAEIVDYLARIFASVGPIMFAELMKDECALLLDAACKRPAFSAFVTQLLKAERKDIP